MQRNALLARVLLIPSLLLAITGPAPIASAHSSRGLPIGPAPAPRAAGAGNDAAFINFETPHVHPIDISPDGNWLAACNTPDGRIEIYSINQTTGALAFTTSVTVGVDPVSVRFRTNDELWAVNAVSDSISVIDRTIGQVTDTIITYRLTDTGSTLDGSPDGDRPMDVVFINGGARAVVSSTTSDRLQLYDTTTLALLDESLRLDGEEPRALATDGSAVWAAIFESGNGTTAIMGIAAGSTSYPPDTAFESASNPYGGQPSNGEFFHDAAPANGTGWNVAGIAVTPGQLSQQPPRSSVIVRDDGAGGWLDDNGRDWAAFVDGANASQSGRFTGWTLLDNDVARVTESSNILSEDGSFGTSGYVTRQMNIVMAIGRNPSDGSIVTVGTDATNEIRFEPNITGTFTRVMVSIVNGTTGSQIALIDLNQEHLDAAQSGPGTAYEDAVVSDTARQQSIGDPRGIAFTPSGAIAYITGMGSNNVVAINATGGSVGERISTGHTIEVPEGPTGIVHHATLDRMYVLSKFAARITVLNTATPGAETTTQTVNLFDPTPSTIKNGRVHLYGTHENSGLGQISCASCHIDVRMDRLGWNLGNPAHVDGLLGQGVEKPLRGEGDGLAVGTGPPQPVGMHNTLFTPEVQSESSFGDFSSMKGVMTTQTLQDIIGKEPLHWRGDRDGIEEFAGAFSGLQGRVAGNLNPTEMQQFEDLLASVWFEPNPLRPLDNALPGGPPLSDAYTGDHDPLDISGQFSPGTTTGKGGFSALGTQLPAGDAWTGFIRYVDTTPDSIFSCVVCHTLPMGAGSTHSISLLNTNEPPDFSATSIPPSVNGAAHLAMSGNDGTGQNHFKVPHYRNEIEKDGFYLNFGPPSRAGFGVLHDGSIDGVARFIAEPAFDTNSDQDLANLVAFVLATRGDDFLRLQGLAGAPTGGIPPAAIDQSSHAAVGAQAVQPNGGSDFYADLFRDIAEDDEIDLVVETRVNGEARRFTYFDTSGEPRYLSDRVTDGLVTQTELEALPDVGFDLTYTALHATTGKRIGIDRDEDGATDRDELDLGTTTTNSSDNAFVGTNIPAAIEPLQTFTTLPAALAGVTPSSGRKAAVHLQGGVYAGAVTISQPVVLRKLVDPTTGTTVGGVVRIGAP